VMAKVSKDAVLRELAARPKHPHRPSPHDLIRPQLRGAPMSNNQQEQCEAHSAKENRTVDIRCVARDKRVHA